ncbi:MAG: hypothetical protein RLN96_06240, partial [Pseudomonadales bacterium]
SHCLSHAVPDARHRPDYSMKSDCKKKILEALQRSLARSGGVETPHRAAIHDRGEGPFTERL